MRRVVVLGRGGAGKSTLAVALGAALGVPVVELDKHLWPPGLHPAALARWAEVRRGLVRGGRRAGPARTWRSGAGSPPTGGPADVERFLAAAR